VSRKVALLIGNSTYGPGLPPLEKPDADIAALGRVLSDPAIGGFDEVKPLLDATSATARREIARFFFGRSPDDLLLLYFSGHGLRNDRGGLYLAVQDTEVELLAATAVPAAFISEEMDNCRSRRQVLILDCCYSGAFERGAKGAAANPVAAFKGNGLGRFVLTASDSTQLAWEDVAVTSKGGMSVFTRHLVAGLESGEADLDGDGFVSVDELYDYVYARVVEENSRQTPGKSASKQQGEIFLARSPAGPRRHQELPATLRQALNSPSAAEREGAIRELVRFLVGNDAGLAEAARTAAEEAINDDNRRVALVASQVLSIVVPALSEPLPSSKPAPERKPAAAIKSVEKRPAPPASSPAARSTPGARPARRKTVPRRASWIALGVLALLGAVASFVSLEVDEIHGPPKASAQPLTPPDPAQVVSLLEAQTWPLVLGSHFDSADGPDGFFQSGSLDLDDPSGTRAGHISSGVLHLSYTAKASEGGSSTLLENRAIAISDFYLGVDLKASRGSAGADAGLVFWTQPVPLPGVQSDSYAFMLHQGSYWVGVYAEGGKWSSLRPLTPSAAIHPGQTNSIAVLAKDLVLTFFINGQKVDQVSVETFHSGMVGLGIKSNGVEPVAFDFDNLELRQGKRPHRGI
jgi:hypothetical protein